MSKKHGEITVIDSTIKIKSCHQNPIFYKIKNDPKKNILMKDSEVILRDSDKFSLLPDEFEWTVRIEQEINVQNDNPTSTFRVRQTDEINANLTQILREEYEIRALEGRETPDLDGRETPDNLDDRETPDNLDGRETPDNLLPLERIQNDTEDALVTETVSSSSRKRSLDSSNDTEGIETKKLKQAQVSSSSTSGNVQQTISDTAAVPQSSDSSNNTITTNIKPDPDSTEMNNQQNMPDQNIPTTSTIKTEPTERYDQQPSSSNSDVKVDTSAVKTEDNPEQQSVRPSCEFGIRCYRMTDDHRREYAHPMDNDYRRPNFPPAPLNGMSNI